VSTRKHPNATSSLKTNFIFAILSIHTIQTIKYHITHFPLQFKFQNILNPPLPPTFSFIPKNITFYILCLSFTLNFFPFFPHFLSHTHKLITTLSISSSHSLTFFSPPSMKPFFLHLLSSFPIKSVCQYPKIKPP